MELPGSAAYMLSPSRSDGPLRIEEWFEERKNTIKAWPLMGFSEFLSSHNKVVFAIFKAGGSSGLRSTE